MTVAGLSRRVAGLERCQGQGWRAWAGVPMERWPDEALWEFLGAAKADEVELEAIAEGDLACSTEVAAAGPAER
jgi:hypothetical protein